MGMQISTSLLFTTFLGLTERQIDSNNHPFGSLLYKIGKQDLDSNMQIILYKLSQQQYFEVIIDKDKDNIVVSQKTYWPDINKLYKQLEENAIPDLSCDYSDGFYLNSPKFGKILCEIVSLPGKPSCIMTSIE